MKILLINNEEGIRSGLKRMILSSGIENAEIAVANVEPLGFIRTHHSFLGAGYAGGELITSYVFKNQ